MVAIARGTIMRCISTARGACAVHTPTPGWELSEDETGCARVRHNADACRDGRYPKRARALCARATIPYRIVADNRNIWEAKRFLSSSIAWGTSNKILEVILDYNWIYEGEHNKCIIFGCFLVDGRTGGGPSAPAAAATTAAAAAWSATLPRVRIGVDGVRSDGSRGTRGLDTISGPINLIPHKKPWLLRQAAQCRRLSARRSGRAGSRTFHIFYVKRIRALLRGSPRRALRSASRNLNRAVRERAGRGHSYRAVGHQDQITNTKN
ncbi:hypothetical protein JYU34_017480 [Plutella xylostella]|uniref:Uncharacterized protein n=1 Tax=Plutella xylostella TaxID=51655 RepID=A0ABQ7Q193_PLUXY|nr:hypothetical protein JYU34_017480 [Plutella xylostella]